MALLGPAVLPVLWPSCELLFSEFHSNSACLSSPKKGSIVIDESEIALGYQKSNYFQFASLIWSDPFSIVASQSVVSVLPSTASGVFQGAPECWVEWYVAPVLQLLPELPATQEQVHFADVHKCEGMRSATADRISQARNRNLQRDAIDLFLSTTRRIKMFCRR